MCVGSSDNTSCGFFFFFFFSIFYIYSSSFFLLRATLYGGLSSFGKISKLGKELRFIVGSACVNYIGPVDTNKKKMWLGSYVFYSAIIFFILRLHFHFKPSIVIEHYSHDSSEEGK